jgi:hypothetical protein
LFVYIRFRSNLNEKSLRNVCRPFQIGLSLNLSLFNLTFCQTLSLGVHHFHSWFWKCFCQQKQKPNQFFLFLVLTKLISDKKIGFVCLKLFINFTCKQHSNFQHCFSTLLWSRYEFFHQLFLPIFIHSVSGLILYLISFSREIILVTGCGWSFDIGHTTD